MVARGDGVKVGMEEGVNQAKHETKGDSILCELESAFLNCLSPPPLPPLTSAKYTEIDEIYQKAKLQLIECALFLNLLRTDFGLFIAGLNTLVFM